MMNDAWVLDKEENESLEQYKQRVYRQKRSGIITESWETIAQEMSLHFGRRYTSNACRFEAKRMEDKGLLVSTKEEETNAEEELSESLKDLITEYKKERYKTADERAQNNYILRRISREETLKEIALEAADKIGAKKILPYCQPDKFADSKKEAILCLSDWHYGLEVNNHWNTFDTAICVDRVAKLQHEAYQFCRNNGVSKLHIVNLSDLIAGRIHSTIRLQSRIDTVTQTMQVAEILAEFISFFCNEGIQVEYYDCFDNHSRLEPIKAESLELESLCRFIPWYLMERLKGYNVNINKNEYADDIITFSVLGGKYRVAGVHGHKDRPGKIVDNLTLMTKENFDLILAAHLHHFSADEKNEVVVISNGCLVGTDQYSKDLRLTSKPSQNIILVSQDSVVDCLKRIVLE